MAQSPIKQITNKQRILGGIALFQPEGSQKWIKFGPVGSVTFTPNLTEIESRSDESGTSQLIGSWITQSDGTIKIADIQMWTKDLYDALFLAERKYKTQQAVASRTLIIENAKPGDVVEIPGIRPSVISVDDGGAHEYDEDTLGIGNGHYTYHQKSRMLEITDNPAGAADDATVTYSLPAITEADKIVEWEIMRTAGIRGKFKLITVADGGLPGDEVEYVFSDVQFRPDGDVSLKGVDAANTASLTGKVYKTRTSFGTVQSLSAFA